MMDQVMTWIGPMLDAAVVALLAAVLWRLGRDPGAAWSEREGRLQALFDDLRTLVAQSEGLARDLDGKLARRETALRTLVAEARDALEPAAATRPARVEVRGDAPAAAATTAASAAAPAPAASAATDPAGSAARIEALATEGVAVEEIARRIGVATAEVRLVIGLTAARAARRRHVAGEETRAHA